MSRLLGIDVGEKRVGLALTDELMIIASPYGCVDRENAVELIANLVKTENISGFVIGMPYLPSGGLGSQANDVNLFVLSLREETEIPIEFESEVLSSVEAVNRLKLSGKKYEKGQIDAMAAAIILESYLSRK